MNDLKFDETGQYLVTISRDKQLVLWDFKRGVSIATFQPNCQVQAVDVSAGARCVTYIPEGIADLAILKPNEAMKAVLDGKVGIPTNSMQTLGIVGTFSSNKGKPGNSQMCALL